MGSEEDPDTYQMAYGEPLIENDGELNEDQLAEKKELTQEELFSLPVVAETVSIEEFESETDESCDELIVSTAEIENMEVIYELLEIQPNQEKFESEDDEEFIINNLDEEVLNLEVLGSEVVESEEVESEEENQFTFDFGLPTTEFTEDSPQKTVHTLKEEEEEVAVDNDAAESIDFQFEVVEKSEDDPVMETSEELSSPHDDSPFDKKIKETVIQKNEERKEHLKKFNHAFKHSMSKIDEFEKQPAYKRMGLELEQPSSSESNKSRLSVDNDKNDEIQLRSNNSFLHDNVD